MNKKFFIHSITIYHDNDDDTFTRTIFNSVYFRHNKKSNVIDKGFEKGSIGTIYIPTTEQLNISNTDIIVEGIIDKEYDEIYMDSNIQKYRVVSIDDNRKGNLQHYKLGVGE